MGYILNVIDEDGNEIPFSRIKSFSNCGRCRYRDSVPCDEITIQILDKKSEILSDEDIDLIMELLLNALDEGGTYGKMKKIMELIDKLNEENTINE
ncbi:MAG: hypothetical protein J6Y78_04425 [Paludibacteraceae bacterium]|nr:hypothetical protein [Paludibacteraceae bacterium]